jgi:hypothetical protein
MVWHHTVTLLLHYACECKLIHYFYLQFTQALLDASKDIDLEVNADKTKYMLKTRYQKAGQKRSIKVL